MPFILSMNGTLRFVLTHLRPDFPAETKGLSGVVLLFVSSIGQTKRSRTDFCVKINKNKTNNQNEGFPSFNIFSLPAKDECHAMNHND